MPFTSDIILAVSSPPGRAVRGLLRASGPGTFELLGGVVDHVVNIRSRGLHRARLRLWNDRSIACLAISFAGPRSYSGEDTVELILPGNPDLLERIIDWLIERADAAGQLARRAGAGEFTARAFLNGRMSLLEAEGVNAMISARSEAELRAAGLLTAGALGELANDLMNDLAGALALVEAGIDFTDQEDVVAISPANLHARLGSITARLQGHLARSAPFEALQAIPWVVIAGAPNAGKSTLFNALLGRERAIVSPIAGTTRDVIAEPLALAAPDGTVREVMLVDIAGLDAADDSFINIEMQQAAARALERAELILRCAAADDRDHDRTREAVLTTVDMAIMTKSDLLAPEVIATQLDCIAVSARDGIGLDALRSAIHERLADRAVSLASDALALLPRHESALGSALDSLTSALEQLESQQHANALAQPEIIASLMRLALDDLASLAGAITPDDILGRIFAGFCIGK